ncbi:11401_t:CDS:2 [Entrophospora sp. SA101]|nr:11401_t:CDS:2 [Entrophospora sp. SA101]
MSSSAVANLSSLKSDVDDINGKMGTMDIEDKEEMVMVEKDGEEEKKGGSISKLIPNTKILPPRSLHFDSTLLKAEQVARLVDWIDRNLADGKVSRVTRCNYAIRIKDKSHGPCFGDKDLWMKNNFNGYDSCSSDKDDYLDRVTTLSKFWVIEYEVFQVIKK